MNTEKLDELIKFYEDFLSDRTYKDFKMKKFRSEEDNIRYFYYVCKNMEDTLSILKAIKENLYIIDYSISKQIEQMGLYETEYERQEYLHNYYMKHLLLDIIDGKLVNDIEE